MKSVIPLIFVFLVFTFLPITLAQSFSEDTLTYFLVHLPTNSTIRVYRFDIANNGNSNLTVNWTFYTGESTIKNQLPITLIPQEDIWVFVAINYTAFSPAYKQVATATAGSFWDSESSNTFEPDLNVTHNALQYDANGNLQYDGEFYYEYNNFNQLSKIRLSNSSGIIIEEYLYDHEGQRILKKTSNESTFYINKNFIRVQNASGNFDTIYYYDKDTLVARKDPDNKTYFYHPDHLGSTTLVTNSTGQVVEETNYYPYGLPLYDAQSRFLYKKYLTDYRADGFLAISDINIGLAVFMPIPISI